MDAATEKTGILRQIPSGTGVFVLLVSIASQLG